MVNDHGRKATVRKMKQIKLNIKKIDSKGVRIVGMGNPTGGSNENE